MARAIENSISDQFEIAWPTSARASKRVVGLLRATGVHDGERFLLRLFPKSNSSLDEDLKNVLSESIRRFRRVLSVETTRSTFVEILEIVEDAHYVGLVMLDCGSSCSDLSDRASLAIISAARTNGGRSRLWKGIESVAIAIDACHRAGIVHGGVGLESVFVDPQSLVFRLGGYESAVSTSQDLNDMSRIVGRTQSVS